MKKVLSYAAVGLAGYFIGFYEMKYKTLKVLLNTTLDLKKNEEKEEES